jgi:hypothetical protein
VLKRILFFLSSRKKIMAEKVEGRGVKLLSKMIPPLFLG